MQTTDDMIDYGSGTGSGFDWNAITGLIQAGLTYAQAYQLNQINVDRAKQGLAPVNVQQYAAGLQANVGVTSDTQKMILWLGGGAILAYVLSSAMKSRRR